MTSFWSSASTTGGFVPTTLANPCITASGLSVDVLRTSTGLRICGCVASSWRPPESVMTTVARLIRARNSK